MQTYISILRGINVSGHKILKMDALRRMFQDLNFKNAHTYIQSGNVVFQHRKTNYQNLESKIAQGIFDDFGFEVPVMVRELPELKAILMNNPFVNKGKRDITKLHATFLSQEPERTAVDKINDGHYDADQFIVWGRTVYLFCPNGYGRTKLSNTFFERKLKTVATTRNWKTLNELVKIAENISNDK